MTADEPVASIEHRASGWSEAAHELHGRHRGSGPTPVVEATFDKVHWEVGVDGAGGWRIDVLVDDGPFPTILEAKRWTGPATISEVDTQLISTNPANLGYIQKAAGAGLTVERNAELNIDQWLEAYVDDTGLVSCVWADEDPIAHAGNIYYAPIVAAPPDVQLRCAVRAVAKAIVTRYLLRAIVELIRILGNPIKAPPPAGPCAAHKAAAEASVSSRASGCGGGVKSAVAGLPPVAVQPPPPAPESSGEITCGTTLAPNTTYVLDADVGPCAGNGVVMADGATLDLNGHRIFGPTTAAGLDEAGILFDSVQNATVTDSAATSVDGRWVGSNAVTMFDAGISILNGSSGNTVEKLNVVGNFGVDGDYAEGVHVRDSDSNTISNNVVVGNGPLAGITLLDGSDGNDLVANVVNANMLALPALFEVGPQVSEAIGIRLEVSLIVGAQCPDDNTISGNTVRGNSLDGISVMDGPACDSAGNVIIGNTVTGNGRDGIGLNARLFSGTCYGAEETTVTSNKVADNGGAGIKATSCVENSDITENVSVLNNPLVPPIAPPTYNAPPFGDLHDGNVNCGSNSWANNTHVTEHAAPGSVTEPFAPIDYLCVK